MNDLQKHMSIVVYFLLGISIPLVGLRCYTRFRVLKSFGVDDALVVVSLLLYASFSVLIGQSIKHGLGEHPSDLSLHNRIEALKYIRIAELVYILLTFLTKAVVATMLLRVSQARVFTLTLWASICINVSVCSAVWLAYLFECKPVAFHWNRLDPSKSGKCINPAVHVYLGYIVSAVTIALDLLYSILPPFMFAKLQMIVKEKVVLICILSLGFFAAIANVVRLRSLVGLANSDDPHYTAPTVIWSAIEAGLSIVIVSVITLRPLFRKFQLASFSTPKNTSQRPSARHPIHGSFHGYVLNSGIRERGSTSSKERMLGSGDIMKQTQVVISNEHGVGGSNGGSRSVNMFG